MHLFNKSTQAANSKKIGSEARPVHYAAVLVAFVGILNIVSSVTPALADRLHLLRRLLPIEVRHGAYLASALAGIGLLMLARNLWRRKRVAWELAMIFLVLSVASHLIKGFDYEESILSGVMAIWLWFERPHFHAQSDRPLVLYGLRLIPVAALLTLAYGTLGFCLLDRHFHTQYGFWTALRQTAIMFTQFYDPGLEPATRFGRYFGDSIYAVGILLFLNVMVLLFRPVLIRRRALKEELAKATEIVQKYGRSSLARVTLFDDKSYFFSEGGSVIAYNLKGRVALVLGDPIGPIEDADLCIREFCQICRSNDWDPVFLHTFPDYLEIYRQNGLDILEVGSEAIVDLNEFNLDGKQNKHLRYIINRLTKLGYTAVMHDPPIEEGLLRELHSVSDEWLTLVKGTEIEFIMGSFEYEYIQECPILAIHDPEGSIVCFANIIPEYQINECTIDLMRRRFNVESGVMEFLFLNLIIWSKSKGYDTFNLGLSPFARVGEERQDPAVERFFHFIYKNVNQFYRFQGLFAFKSKFKPAWEPRYMAFPGITNLPYAGIALVRAVTGDALMWKFLKRYSRYL